MGYLVHVMQTSRFAVLLSKNRERGNVLNPCFVLWENKHLEDFLAKKHKYAREY